MRELVLLSLLALPAAGHAAQGCEDNFQATGDPRNGAKFATFVTLPGLDVRSALGQMQKIALDDGFQIGNEDIGEREGTLTIVQKSSMLNRGFTIYVTADADGKVGINTRLNKGQQAKAEDIRGSMCKMLARLQAGAEGLAIADATRAKTGTDKVVNVKAHKLARELAKEASSAEKLPLVAPKYLNKTYRLDGIVRLKSEPAAGGMEIDFDVTDSADLGFKQDKAWQEWRPSIKCVMAPDQGEYFAGLEEEGWATVIGKVTKFEWGLMTLENCRRD